jgi:predicted ferric reductase
LHDITRSTCLVALLFHAVGSWYLVLPPLALYVASEFLSQKQIVAASTCLVLDDLVIADNSDTLILDVKATSSKKPFLMFHVGQYCCVNIPAISFLEWRYFPIVGYPWQRTLRFVVKRDRNSSADHGWTNKLIALKRCGTALKLIVRMQGPYGLPLNAPEYRKIILVGEGGGVTSLISYFHYMLQLALVKETQISIGLIVDQRQSL